MKKKNVNQKYYLKYYISMLSIMKYSYNYKARESVISYIYIYM